jgi:hypothetical protein
MNISQIIKQVGKILKYIGKAFLVLLLVLFILNFFRISSEDISSMIKNKLPEKLELQAFEKLMNKYNFKCENNLNQENKEIHCQSIASSIFILGSCEFHLDVVNNNKIIYVKKRDYICVGL